MCAAAVEPVKKWPVDALAVPVLRRRDADPAALEGAAATMSPRMWRRRASGRRRRGDGRRETFGVVVSRRRGHSGGRDRGGRDRRRRDRGTVPAGVVTGGVVTLGTVTRGVVTDGTVTTGVVTLGTVTAGVVTRD